MRVAGHCGGGLVSGGISNELMISLAIDGIAEISQGQSASTEGAAFVSLGAL